MTIRPIGKEQTDYYLTKHGVGRSDVRTYLCDNLPELAQEMDMLRELTGDRFKRCDISYMEDGYWDVTVEVERQDRGAIDQDMAMKAFGRSSL